MSKFIVLVFALFYLINIGNCATLKDILSRKSNQHVDQVALSDQINKLREYSEVGFNTSFLENFKFNQLFQYIPENLTIFDIVEKYLVPEFAQEYFEEFILFLFDFPSSENIVECLIDQLENTKVLNECILKETFLLNIFSIEGNASQTLIEIDNLLNLQLKDLIIALTQESNILDIFGVRYFSDCLVNTNDSKICFEELSNQFSFNLPFNFTFDYSIIDMNLRKILLVMIDEYNLKDKANSILFPVQHLIYISKELSNWSSEEIKIYLQRFYFDQFIDNSLMSISYFINCGFLQGNLTKRSDFEACIMKNSEFNQIYSRNLQIVSFYLRIGIGVEMEELLLHEFYIEYLTKFGNLLTAMNIKEILRDVLDNYFN